MQNTELKFRAASATDIPAVCRLRIAYLTEDVGEMTPEMQAQVAAQLPEYFAAHLGRDCFVNIAETGTGEAVGCVILVCTEKPANPFFPHGKSGTVYGVYTVPEYSGQGIATALMKRLIADGEAAGLDRIVLSASEMGRPIYEKLGFQPAHSKYTEMELISRKGKE